MKGRRLLSISFALLVLLSFLLGSIGQLQNVTAAPSSPVDESKVPHYFGPYPNWANSPLTLPDINVAIVGDGAGATASAVVAPDGSVSSIAITNPGSGYTAATVDITGLGTGAQASATVAATGAVTQVAILAGGNGYTSPTVSFSGGGGSGTLVQVGNPLLDREYSSDTATSVFVVVPQPLPTGQLESFLSLNQALPGGGTQPSAGYTFNAYVLRPTGAANEYQVVFDSGLITVPALADLNVSEIAAYPASVPVLAGDVLAFYGQGIPVDISGGPDLTHYPVPTAPVQGGTLTLGSPEFPSYAQARTYSFAANVLDSSGVSPLVPASATVYGGVDQVSLISGGLGYTFPTVDFDMPDGPDGVQPTAHAEFNPETGEITAIVVDNPGSGYSAPPNVVIRDGTLFDPIRNNAGSGAVASATLLISSIVVDNPGSGYISAPLVAVNDPTGNGAIVEAQVNAGTISAIEVTAPGSGYLQVGIRKFIDSLPLPCYPNILPGDPGGCPEGDPAAKFLPLAIPELKLYNGVEADEYEIGLIQYRTSFSSDLPPTLVRGYVQLETADNVGYSEHFPLQNELLDGTLVPTGYFGVTSPQYLGPIIGATKDKPVRIIFRNLLPTGADGDLFLPTDSTLMGSGMGPMDMMDPMNENSVMDGVRNPLCSEYPKSDMCFKDNRATLHLHGGITPWISDGTPHQWITPAGEMTPWPEGVSVENVPDMDVCEASDDGCQTFYYTNQQSARLMFYHDHAWGITRLNVYAGEAAGYLITDPTEQALINNGIIPADQLPLIVQDKTFVPGDAQLAAQDPTWDKARWGGEGNMWAHHVYMPAQNPGDPGGMSGYGRWMYGPWFWPPAADTVFGPIPNPYYNMDPATGFTTPLAVPCNIDDPATWQYDTDPFCEPEQIPGTPNISVGMEQFNDTPVVNGIAYPTLTVEPKAYRLRVLNAANDRFFNLQWYIADPTTGTLSEVALKAAEVAAAQLDPVVFPTPDTTISLPGPDWVQIGTEGGFLPAPVVVDGQQVTTWITDPTRFDVGNVDLHSLLLAPAERADAIVDFSQFAGQTLILYNDAPAAFPARVPQYDYYTGAPDLSPAGAPTILPGYGPNTRTVMQVVVAANPPATAFDLPGTSNDGLGRLQSAFRHNANGTGVFESGQHPIIVGQAAYNSAYGTGFAASSNCNAPGSSVTRCDGFVRVSDTLEFGFNTLLAPNAKMTIPLQPKAIHDEMNASTFDEFGRMSANLGIEAQPPTPGLQNVTLYPFVNPSTELIDASGLPVADVVVTPIASADDGTQIWRVTHNGVDTHPIHFHLYDVQLVNRVTWDNIIIPPDKTELGWKDTVRMAPLEDTIVALRPIIPKLPWELPNSIRNLSPMMPTGSTAMFNNVDAQGIPTAPIINDLVNFGWEYVYHCHILSHEEMDMMRPVSVAMPPVKADGLIATVNGSGATLSINLSWNDNSIAETSYLVQRMVVGSGVWEDVWTDPSPLDQFNGTGIRSFDDLAVLPGMSYQYQVVALNTIGYGGAYMALTVQSVSDPVTIDTPIPPDPPATPSDLAAALDFGPQVNLSWTDNAINETGYVVQRRTGAGAFEIIANLGADSVSFLDATVQLSTSYTYQVYAENLAGASAASNQATVVIPAAPLAPTNLVLIVQGALNPPGPRIRVTFRDNQNGGNPETGFQVFRSDNGGPFFLLATLGPRAGAGSVTYFDYAIVGGNTYSYYVVTINAATASAPTLTVLAAIPPAPAAPSNFTGTATLTNGQTRVRVNLSWTDNANNEARFVIQRATDPDFTVGLVTNNRAANSTTFTQNNLARGTTYYFRIAAQNLYGYSAWVNFSITTP